jgi:hypothetical protein
MGIHSAPSRALVISGVKMNFELIGRFFGTERIAPIQEVFGAKPN